MFLIVSGAEIIEQIQSLSEPERHKLLLRIDEVFEDEKDVMAADAALARNDFVDWDQAKRELSKS